MDTAGVLFVMDDVHDVLSRELANCLGHRGARRV